MTATWLRGIKGLISKFDDFPKTGISLRPLWRKARRRLRDIRVALGRAADWCASQTSEYLIPFTTKNHVPYDGVKVDVFYHDFNCGNAGRRTTERAVELGIAQYWVSKHNADLVEIGAVTPYYFPGLIKEIVDPSDESKEVSLRKSLFDVDLTGKNVLSISTVEHIGTGDYGLSKNENCIDALDKILKDSLSCLITIPIGYNRILDSYIRSGAVAGLARTDIYFRSKRLNNWRHTKNLSIIDRISYGPLWANGLIIISKQ
jgi:hypothetical protein